MPEQKERFKVLYTDDKLKAAAESLKVQRNAEAPIRADTKSGKNPLTINSEKQARRMQETAIQGRSIVTVSMGELQEIINNNAGNGRIDLTRDLTAWKHTEIIAVGREIGYTVNKDGKKKTAYSIKIHYSNTGTHAVPFSGWWKK